MRGLLFILMLAWTATAQAHNFWDKLWLTPDQRGEQLMQQGDLDAAARTFRDPRHKAYAELKAGQYLQAAHDLAKSDSSDDLYNRGNALARAGKLQEAIKAYDAALHRDPHNRDAKHNRELVEKALQKQQHQTKPSAGNSSSSGKNGQKSKAGNSAKKKSGAPQNHSGQNRTGKDQKGKTGQGKPGDNHSGQQHNKGGQESQPTPPHQVAQANTNKSSKDSANQARRDALAGLNQLPATQHRDKTAPAPPPLNEQQLSQEQWLRQIPDDPGGLLRRKFMIEHMLRQREEQQ